MKEKKKEEKTVLQKISAEKLLEFDNSSVLTYVEKIENLDEREAFINELISYLENCLLDRDVGKPGPKLKDQLKKRLTTTVDAIKGFEPDDLIWWKGTEGQLIYLYEELVKNNLIDDSQKDRKYLLLSKHFKNKMGKNFKNKQMGQAAQNLVLNKTKKPSKSKEIEDIVLRTKEAK